ncbi:MAG: hypothetical protein ACKO81_09465 [Planctomycetota bacterium]
MSTKFIQILTSQTAKVTFRFLASPVHPIKNGFSLKNMGPIRWISRQFHDSGPNPALGEIQTLHNPDNRTNPTQSGANNSPQQLANLIPKPQAIARAAAPVFPEPDSPRSLHWVLG